MDDRTEGGTSGPPLESATYRAGWYPDPVDRYEFRYHNGTAWTSDVSVNGDRFVDPVNSSNPQHSALGAVPSNSSGTTDPLRNGHGTAALVLGIISLVIGWLPYVFVVGAICAILALVFATIGLRRARDDDRPRGAAIAGLVTGATGVAAAIVGLIFTIAFARALDRYDKPGPFDAQITSCSIDESATTSDELVRYRAVGTVTNLDTSERDYVVTVDFVRPGTDNAQRRRTVSIPAVAAGESADFELEAAVRLADADCVIAEVTGPLPFGVSVD